MQTTLEYNPVSTLIVLEIRCRNDGLKSFYFKCVKRNLSWSFGTSTRHSLQKQGCNTVKRQITERTLSSTGISKNGALSRILEEGGTKSLYGTTPFFESLTPSKDESLPFSLFFFDPREWVP